MSGPCDNLRIVDLSSGPLGGIATMVLADFGADVVKVEPPDGDPFRRLPSAPMWLRGKRSVTLDLSTAAGCERLHALAAGADVVVASFAPGEAGAAGAGPETLRAINPRLVYCSITGWGPKGPYANYPVNEGVVAAKTGRYQSVPSWPVRPAPYFMPVQVGTHATSQAALTGILAALLVRERTGRGQLIETSLLQGMFPYDLHGLVRVQLTQRYPDEMAPPGAPQPNRNSLQYIPVLAGDGRWIQFANLMEHLFHSMISAADLTDIYSDPRFVTAPNLATADDVDALRAIILARLRERPAAEWMAIFSANGNVAAEPFTTSQEALWHPDLIANREVVEHQHPRLGAVRQLGLIARLTATPGTVGAAAPEAGQDTAAVLAEAPAPKPVPTSNGGHTGAAPRHPLTGIRVVEFATVIAVPLGASILGDLGARVIKVEPTEGDPYRGMGVGLGAYIGSSKTTASKESICVDLRSAEGQAIAHRLLADADVLIHNYRPDVPARLGIDYETLQKLNPRLVYIACAGYGPDGPGAKRPAAHPIPGAVDGAALCQAGADGAPANPGSPEALAAASAWMYAANESSPDPNTSVAVASAAMLALYARTRTGMGQRVVLSMLGANAYANWDDFVSYEGKPARPAVDAGLHGTGPNYRLYAAKSGWVFFGVTTPDEWRRFCRAVGRPEIEDRLRFPKVGIEPECDAGLEAAIAGILAARDAGDWEEALIAAGVPCVRADQHSPGTFFLQDEHMRANGFAPEAAHALWGRYQRWGPAVTFSETPGRYGPGVLAGQDTDALLSEFGYSPEDIARLRIARAVSTVAPMRLPAPVT